MAAIVCEHARLAVLAANENDWSADRVEGQVVAGVGHLLFTGEKEPAFQQNVFALGGEYGRVSVESCRH